MDYLNRLRLKVLAHARVVDPSEEPETIAKLSDSGYRARIERGLIFEMEAFDWNCPQHITQRLAVDEMQALSATQSES